MPKERRFDVDEMEQLYRKDCQVIFDMGEWYKTANISVRIEPNCDPLACLMRIYLDHKDGRVNGSVDYIGKMK